MNKSDNNSNGNFIENYMTFLDGCKTERLCAEEIVRQAEKAGYRNLEDCPQLGAGDRVYTVKMGKAVILFEAGTDTPGCGMNIVASHIDSPRLDVKQNPVYEKDGLVWLNTHYYGGIKKYQWLALPLAIYGVVFLRDGSRIDVSAGDRPDEPVFTVPDILPHIAQVQMAKTASAFIEGENLDLVIGIAESSESRESKENGKRKILDILRKKYGFEEEDLASAELEIVPAGKSRFAGFDRSMVLGYGQDDRVCAFAALQAMLSSGSGKRTKCCVFADKEEIGSVGATGMDSRLLYNAVCEFVARMKTGEPFELTVSRTLSNSFMLSADVSTVYDPLHTELYDRNNSTFFGGGVAINKYNGKLGKEGSSDANPEFVALLRRILDKEKIRYQFGEPAKVDTGGFGTIAKYASYYGMQVIDCGVPVYSMHAPWELTCISDIEQTLGCYRAFFSLQ